MQACGDDINMHGLSIDQSRILPVPGTEENIILSQIAEIGSEIKYTGAIMVIDEGSIARNIISIQNRCYSIRIGSGNIKHEIDTILNARISRQRTQHRRPVEIGNGNPHNQKIRNQ